MIALSDDKLAKDERTTVSSYLKLGWEWRDFPTAKSAVGSLPPQPPDQNSALHLQQHGWNESQKYIYIYILFFLSFINLTNFETCFIRDECGQPWMPSPNPQVLLGFTAFGLAQTCLDYGWFYLHRQAATIAGRAFCRLDLQPEEISIKKD